MRTFRILQSQNRLLNSQPNRLKTPQGCVQILWCGFFKNKNMDYRDVPFKGLKFSYIIYENGDVYRIINDKKRLVPPRDEYICLTEESGRRVQIKHVSLLLHSFYGGYFKRRKFKIRNTQKPLHIKNVKWKEGFGEHIDFEYLDNLDVNKLNFENSCIRSYYYTDDARYIIKILDKNKGLYSHTLMTFMRI